MLNRLVPLMLGLTLVTVAAAPAQAQGAGVRAGVSVNPDQFYVGGHVETDALVERVHLRPNIEIGFGDNVTTVAVNIEAVYKVPLRRSPWTFYGGGGPAINYYNFETGSDTEAGLNVLAGMEHERGFFFEVKAGAVDSPDLKFGVGFVLGR